MALQLININPKSKIFLEENLKNAKNDSLNKLIDYAWRDELENNKRLFNGDIVSVIKCTDDTLRVSLEEYKNLIAQNMFPHLYKELRIQPLAFSGLLECEDGFVIGRRNQYLTQDSGKWEFVPSGGVVEIAHDLSLMSTISNQVKEELSEEIGVTYSLIKKLDIFCVIYDQHSRVFDIGIHIKVGISFNELFKKFISLRNDEYDVISYLHPTDFKKLEEVGNFDLAKVSKQLRKAFLNKENK